MKLSNSFICGAFVLSVGVSFSSFASNSDTPSNSNEICRATLQALAWVMGGNGNIPATTLDEGLGKSANEMVRTYINSLGEFTHSAENTKLHLLMTAPSLGQTNDDNYRSAQVASTNSQAARASSASLVSRIPIAGRIAKRVLGSGIGKQLTRLQEQLKQYTPDWAMTAETLLREGETVVNYLGHHKVPRLGILAPEHRNQFSIPVLRKDLKDADYISIVSLLTENLDKGLSAALIHWLRALPYWKNLEADIVAMNSHAFKNAAGEEVVLDVPKLLQERDSRPSASALRRAARDKDLLIRFERVREITEGLERPQINPWFEIKIPEKKKEAEKKTADKTGEENKVATHEGRSVEAITLEANAEIPSDTHQLIEEVRAIVGARDTRKKVEPSPNHSKVVQSLLEYRDAIMHRILERGYAVDAGIQAIIEKEHVILTGPAGEAKTLLADLLLGNIEVDETPKDEAEVKPYFRLQLHPETTTNDLFGPMKYSGITQDKFERLVEEGLVPAYYAFFDEFFDPRIGLIRSLNGMMAERALNQGFHRHLSNLRTVFGATNKYRTELYERAGNKDPQASLDRFARPIFIPGRLFKIESRQTVVQNHFRNNTIPKMKESDIETLRKYADQVVIPEEVGAGLNYLYNNMHDLTDEAHAKSVKAKETEPSTILFYATRHYSTRTLGKEGKMLRTAALIRWLRAGDFNAPPVATVEDLAAMESSFTSAAPETQFLEYIAKTSKDRQEQHEAQTILIERGLFLPLLKKVKDSFEIADSLFDRTPADQIPSDQLLDELKYVYSIYKDVEAQTKNTVYIWDFNPTYLQRLRLKTLAVERMKGILERLP